MLNKLLFYKYFKAFFFLIFSDVQSGIVLRGLGAEIFFRSKI